MVWSVKSISLIPYEPVDYATAKMYSLCRGLFLMDGILTKCTVGSVLICYRGRDIAPNKLEEMIGTYSKEFILEVENNTVYCWFRGYGYIVSCYQIEDIYVCVIKNQKIRVYVRASYSDKIDVVLDQSISHAGFLRHMII